MSNIPNSIPTPTALLLTHREAILSARKKKQEEVQKRLQDEELFCNLLLKFCQEWLDAVTPDELEQLTETGYLPRKEVPNSELDKWQRLRYWYIPNRVLETLAALDWVLEYDEVNDKIWLILSRASA